MNAEHLDLILDSALSKACDTLEKGEDVKPYLLVMDQNAFIHFSEDFDQEVYDSDPEELLSDLMIRLQKRSQEEKIKGGALVCQVKVKHPDYGEYCNAINALVEYNDGNAFDCFLPYNKIENGVEYGEVFTSKVESKVFPKA